MFGSLLLCGISAGVPARAADEDGADIAKAFPPLRMLWAITFEIKPCVQTILLQALVEPLSVARSRGLWCFCGLPIDRRRGGRR
jgi:hypothetical protein